MSDNLSITVLLVLVALFVLFVYVKEMNDENERLYNIAVQQEQVIQELRAAITSLQILNTLQGNQITPIYPYNLRPKEELKTDPI